MANMIIVALGGISGPRTPPHVSAPRPRALLYEYLLNSGTATFPTAIIVGPLAPRAAAIPASPMMLATNSPPGNRDIQFLAVLKRCSPIFVSAIRKDMRVKSGSGVQVRL